MKVGYALIYNKREVNIYNGCTVSVRIVVLGVGSLEKGCWCLRIRMWRLSLQHIVCNEQTVTLVLDSPFGTESFN